jgi:membrane protein
MSNTVRGPESEETIGALVHQLTEQVPQLVRSEVKLAQAELAEKGKRAGLGVGMFSAAGLLAFFALATLIATAVLALDLVLPAWAAALIVAGVLLVAAGVAGLLGRSKVRSATPAKPERAMEGMRQDVETIKGNGS